MKRRTRARWELEEAGGGRKEGVENEHFFIIILSNLWKKGILPPIIHCLAKKTRSSVNKHDVRISRKYTVLYK